MISRPQLGLPLIFRIALVALTALFLNSAPLSANQGFANQTGQACATCHSTGFAPTAASLNATGQNFVLCGYVLNCSLTPNRPPQVSQPQQPVYQGNPGYTPAAPVTASFDIGDVWIVRVREGSGRFADLIWTRRGRSNIFDVVWEVEGKRFAEVIEYEGYYSNGTVSFYSLTTQYRFSGIPSNDGNYINNGTISGANAGPNDRWSATIFGE